MLALLDCAKKVIEQKHHPDGYNIGINDGVAAGQTVPHLHLHLIPRYEGDLADARQNPIGVCQLWSNKTVLSLGLF